MSEPIAVPGHSPDGHSQHADSHDHPPTASQDEAPDDARTIVLEQQILAKNDHLAAHNRGWLTSRGILSVNLMSSPGSGKTTLLERTLRGLDSERSVAVIEGDQESMFDADRIRATGAPVLQINTGGGCHLDANMVGGALRSLDPQPGALLFIENVGNLVCPALFDLGQHSQVVIMSVTEGAEKPLKYPNMFRTADLVLLNKIDLLPYVDFDVDDFTQRLAQVNPSAPILHCSATRGDGVDDWQRWLTEQADTLTATK
ncbi:MAG: hydrogenase nickel incorporation protein HypB [Actinomycetota bacterium]|nr:hydrogenase nickel incorporation protein HypB [Actinomycetota bacterium]